MFEATYDPQQADVNDSMLIRGPDGKRVPYVAGMYQTGSTGLRSLAPGETDMLISGLDLASQYLFTKPGSYTIQFRGLPALGQGFGQAIPPSGEITVKMQPGKLPFEMQVPARLLEVLPAEWDIRLNMRVAEVESGNVHPPGWKTGPGTYVELVSHPNKEESTPNVEIWVAKRRLVPKNAKAGQPAVYLGEGADGHVYWQVNAKAKTAWPDIEKKVKAALRIATPEAKARAAK